MTLAAALERIEWEIDTGNMTPFEVAEFLDKKRIVANLQRCDWNVSAAAQLLGISRNTLHRRILHFDIQRPEPEQKAVRCGPKISAVGVRAKELGVMNRRVRSNGLDRPMSDLALRVRLNQLKGEQ